MVWCAHCQEDCCTVDDHDKGFLICCCTGCGRVLDQDVFSDEPTFVIDGSDPVGYHFETGVSKINSDSAEFELLACEVHRSIGLSNSCSVGHQAVDASECTELQDLENSADEDPENLSDIDDVEADGYLHNEKCLKTIMWEEMNEHLEEQAEKEAACEVNSNGEAVVKPKKKRKQRSSEEEKNSAPAETPLEATRQMLKKKSFSSRVNYEELESLYATEQETVTKQEDKLDTGDANGSETGAVDDGYEVVSFEYDPFGNEDKATLAKILNFDTGVVPHSSL